MHNFNKDGPLILGTSDYVYNFEIDISDYNIGDYIVFILTHSYPTISVKYQYKNNFKSNNYINIGEYKDGFYFIQIQKTVQDSSMILNLNISSVIHEDYEILTLFDTFKYDFEEITSDYNKTIRGPKLFYIDDFKFNKNFNSYGIQSNESYFFLESENGIASFLYYRNISIINRNYGQAINKVFYIFFNNQNYSLFEIKRFKYIIYKENVRFNTYFQLCQGKDLNKELILYIDNSFESVHPVFGKYNISFIDEDNIKKLSDLDFDNKKESKMYWNSKGYLKIICNEPTMIKHSYFNNKNNLLSGERVTVSFDNLEKKNYFLDSSLVNKVIPLKFNILGLDNNESIQLNLSETIYELKNNESLEINYFYERFSINLFKFSTDDEEIKKKVKIEIIIGYLEKNIDSLKVIDFDKALGELKINSFEKKFIKVQKNFTDDLLDYVLILNDYNSQFEIEIAYDKLEYIVPRQIGEAGYYIFPKAVPLFKINPYSMISENETISENKYFYILIYNKYKRELNVLIKKPKIISEIKFNELYILPELIGGNENYYYELNLPNLDYNYNYLSVQIVNGDSSLTSIKSSFYHNSFYNSFSLITNDINFLDNSIQCLNIYDIKNISYIIIAPSNVINYNNYGIDKLMKLNSKIEQIKDTNKLNIKMNSLSYYYSYLKFKYYLIINLEENSNLKIVENISGNKKPDENQEILVKEENNNNNEIFEYEVEIKKNLSSYNNSIIIVPANKENNIILFNFRERNEFNFIYHNENEEEREEEREEEKEEDDDDGISSLAIALIIVGIILLIIIIVAIVLLLKKKRYTNSDSIESNVLNQELNRLQEE